MKKSIWIAGILLLFVILKSESCGELNEGADQQNLLNQYRNEIRSLFETAELNDQALFEFEQAAKQKLADFADYLQILSDTSFRKPYREKAGEMILQMFISDTIRVRILSHNQKPDCETNVSQLVKKGLNNEIPLLHFDCDSVQVLRYFNRTAVDVYSAEFSFIERWFSGKEIAETGLLKRKIVKVYILKGNKIFPPDTLSLWQVYLGGVQ
jgi:predicted DNA-binding protein YlxM (UPF0122 family)